jgi:hypothetical protein
VIGAPLARRLGIDPDAFGLLLRFQLRRDFQGSGAKAAEDSAPDDSPLIVNVAHNLALSLLVAYFAYVNFEPFGFAFLQMLILMAAVAMSLVAEFGVALVDPDDHPLLSPLPISTRTYFAARAVNALFYVGVVATSWSLPGAILAGFLHGGSVAAGLRHLLAALLAGLSSAAFVVLGYGLLSRAVAARQVHEVILKLQVLFSIAVFLGLLYGPALLPGVEGFVPFSRSAWALAVPPAWFGALAAGGPAPLAAVALLTPLVVAVVLLRLSIGYAAALRSHASARRPGEREVRGAGRLAALFRRVFVRRDERAAFDLTAILMARERPFRLRSYPLLGFPIALVVLALTTRSPHDRLVWLMLLMYAPNLYFPAVVSLLPHTANPEAAWIWRTSPVEARGAAVLGAQKAFLLRFVLPLYALVAVFAVWLWDPVAGLGNAAAAGLVACLFTAFDFMRLPDLPFTLAPSRTFSQLDTSRFMGRVLLLAVISSAQFFLVAANPILLAAILPVLAGMLGAVHGWQRRSLLGPAVEGTR